MGGKEFLLLLLPEKKIKMRKRIVYFDNAATTSMDFEVIDEMIRIYNDFYGNPSSIHSLGRASRVIIEDSRRLIAELLNVNSDEIYFTSGGTEAVNIAISGFIHANSIKNVITSSIEHPAVLKTLEYLSGKGLINTHFVNVNHNGEIDLEELKKLIMKNMSALVCLMHANNETGVVLPVAEVSAICENCGAFFMSDMVQTTGKYKIDLGSLHVDLAAASAHKFHGPKGIGFLYSRKSGILQPLVFGGKQERALRSGTENIAGIAGMAKAMEVANRDMQKNELRITALKNYCVAQLRKHIPSVTFNAESDKSGLYNLFNVSFSLEEYNDMLVQLLDMEGICVSGGSACSSGAVKYSPVLKAIGADISRPALRIAFSKYNSIDEIDYFINALIDINIKNNPLKK